MPSPVAVDTSALVATLLSWHDHHELATAALDEAARAAPLLVPAPALVECYAVLTRLPAPHRLSPSDAHALLHENFSAAPVTSLTGAECWRMLAALAKEGVAGGRTYDAQILAAARKGGARALITLNTSDFEALVGGRRDIEIRSPLPRG